MPRFGGYIAKYRFSGIRWPIAVRAVRALVGMEGAEAGAQARPGPGLRAVSRGRLESVVKLLFDRFWWHAKFDLAPPRPEAWRRTVGNGGPVPQASPRGTYLQICERFGVSRTAVRSAIAQMDRKGRRSCLPGVEVHGRRPTDVPGRNGEPPRPATFLNVEVEVEECSDLHRYAYGGSIGAQLVHWGSVRRVRRLP